MQRFKFRDLFALTIWLTSILVYVLDGYGVIDVPDMVIGGLISVDTLVAQFYFRKKPRGEN